MTYLVRWTYVLGFICALTAVLWRGMMTMGYWLPKRIILGRTIYDMSFYKGALLLLLLSIASASYADHRDKHRPQPRRRELIPE